MARTCDKIGFSVTQVKTGVWEVAKAHEKGGLVGPLLFCIKTAYFFR